MADLNTCSPAQFIDALKRSHLDDKRAMLEDLGRKPEERSVEILVEVLHGESWYLRDLAANAMANLGEAGVPALNYLLESGLWYTRAAAARALGKMGHAPSLARLVALLSDPNHTVEGACLASIADLVRAGHGPETARLFRGLGRERSRELSRVLVAVHPDAGTALAELLADPSSYLEEVSTATDETAPARAKA